MRTFPFGTQTGIEKDPVLRELRETEPVCKVRLVNGGQAWLITRYDHVRMVESDPRFSRAEAAKPGTPKVWPDMPISQSIVYLDPPRHGSVRALMSSAFTARRVSGLRPRIQQIVNELLDKIEEHEAPADLFHMLAHPMPLLVVAELLGMPPTDQTLFRIWMTVIQDLNSSAEQIGKIFADLHAYLVDLIASKRTHPGDDVLTAMINAAGDGARLSNEELLQNAQNLIFAGIDTTANMLTNSVITLFRHPDQIELLRQRPDLLPDAIEELLRYVPIIVASPSRIAMSDVDLGGITIPAGDTVLTIERSANKDRRAFDEPERFDITRSGKPPHVTFGHGTHFCLGAALARLQLTIAIGTLLQRFPNLRLAVPDSELEWLPNLLLFTVRELPVRW
jgi:nocardicin N-oxygenase